MVIHYPSRKSLNVNAKDYSMCPIIIGNHTPIDTSRHEPDPSLETTLRVLEVCKYRIVLGKVFLILVQIDNDLVRKQLVINQSIEQTVLSKAREDGVAAVEGPNRTNVRQCFTLNAQRGGLRLSYGYGGGLTQNFIEPFRGIPRMKTDIEYQIKLV